MIYYSATNPKPEANSCDGIAENTACLVIEAPDQERFFTREYLYLKLETIMGCKAKLKLVFPKQDLVEAKLKKNLDAGKSGGGKGAPSAFASKKKLKKDIEY